MKLKERLSSYSDEYLESILYKRNGYDQDVANAAIEEALLRGLITSAEEVHFKYPLIPRDENFGSDVLNQIHKKTGFEKVKNHYLVIGWIGFAFSLLAHFKGYFFVPLIVSIYLFLVYRCALMFNHVLYRVIHVLSYIIAIIMVIFFYNSID